jgi:di/tricarboxylate transporter
MGPGGYSVADFMLVDDVMTLVYVIVSLQVMNYFV